ncbi:unnamed protein product [Effrenium voratum]|nr:unnamed protein product [Effrenium voratum]
MLRAKLHRESQESGQTQARWAEICASPNSQLSLGSGGGQDECKGTLGSRDGSEDAWYALQIERVLPDTPKQVGKSGALRCKSCSKMCCMVKSLLNAPAHQPLPNDSLEALPKPCHMADAKISFWLSGAARVMATPNAACPANAAACGLTDLVGCEACGAWLGWAFPRSLLTQLEQRDRRPATAERRRLRALACPDQRKASVLPTSEITVKFASPDFPENVAWCSLTNTWHCKVNTEVLVTLVPCAREEREGADPRKMMAWETAELTGPAFLQSSATSSGSFQITAVSANATPDHPTQQVMQRHGDVHVTRWTGLVCGQTNFHARWTGDSRNVRVFANAASIYVQPEWDSACEHCELKVLKSPEACDVANVAKFEVQFCLLLKGPEQQVLRCPCGIAAVAALGPSFGGLGPHTQRWKPAVAGLESKVTSCWVDINRGILSYTLSVTSPENQCHISLSLIDQQSCAVKGSPCVLQLPARWTELAPQLPCRRPGDRLMPGLTGGLHAEWKPDERDSPKSRLAGQALAVSAREKTGAGSPGSPGAPGSPGSPGHAADGEVKAHGRLFLRPVSVQSRKNDESSIPGHQSLRCDRPMSGNSKPSKPKPALDALLSSSPLEPRHAERESKLASPSHELVSPRRYMPAELLPSSGWARKRKSKSPRKSRR